MWIKSERGIGFLNYGWEYNKKEYQGKCQSPPQSKYSLENRDRLLACYTAIFDLSTVNSLGSSVARATT